MVKPTKHLTRKMSYIEKIINWYPQFFFFLFLCRWSAGKNGICEELDGLGAMELTMGAWADWVASKVDPLKKRVFFVTMSPTHLW